MTPDTQQKTVAIVGGGLAGLAAGCALADAGLRVTVFERRPYVGGRASSYEHPGTGEVVDNCQHVLLGCCTNLIDFYDRLGVAAKIRWFDELTFIEPGGRASRMSPSFLPAPMHNVPGISPRKDAERERQAGHCTGHVSHEPAIARGFIRRLSFMAAAA